MVNEWKALSEVYIDYHALGREVHAHDIVYIGISLNYRNPPSLTTCQPAIHGCTKCLFIYSQCQYYHIILCSLVVEKSLAMCVCIYMYTQKNLSNRPPPQIDHSPISIALFVSQTIAHSDILTPQTYHLPKWTI